MMAQKGFDHRLAIAGPTMFIHAAIANWENEGGAVLPTTEAAETWRRTSKTLQKRLHKSARKNH